MDAYRGSVVKTERCGETVAYEVLAGIRVYGVDQTGRRVYNAKCLVCGHSWQDRGNSRVCPAFGVPPVPPTVADLEEVDLTQATKPIAEWTQILEVAIEGRDQAPGVDSWVPVGGRCGAAVVDLTHWRPVPDAPGVPRCP